MNLYVHRLADELSKRGVRVDVYTRRADKDTPSVSILASGARVIQLSAGPERPLPKSSLAAHVSDFAHAMQSFQQTHRIAYDVLHSHYWLSGLAALQVREPITPHVHMFHTLSRVKAFHTGHLDPSDTLARPEGERQIIEAADAIVGSTDNELDLMRDLYHAVPQDFAVVPPGVDVAHFRPQDKVYCRKLLGLGDGPIIVYVGRDDPIKGLDRLLQAVAMIRGRLTGEPTVMVIGGASSGRRNDPGRARHIAQRLGIEDRVHFLGSVVPARLPLYYAAADVCAVPSAYESFGMVAIEAMACGTPVVAFTVGGLLHTVADGKTGFLAPPGNLVDYADRLVDALTRPDLGIIGRQAHLAAQRWTWGATADGTLELYARLRGRVSAGSDGRCAGLFRG